MKHLIIYLLVLTGCTTTPEKIKPIEKKVPIAVACIIEIPETPKYNFTLRSKSDDIFLKVKALLADRELDKGYKDQLLTALKGCRQTEK